MADLNAILDSIKELKLLEVAELVKMMEDEFGVSAAAPVMVAGAADGAAAGGAEKSEFDVVLAEAGCIKAWRNQKLLENLQVLVLRKQRLLLTVLLVQLRKLLLRKMLKQ